MKKQVRTICSVFAICVTVTTAHANTSFNELYETDRSAIKGTAVDAYVTNSLSKAKLKPANLCSDQVFLRRIYIDMIGTLPTPKEAREFYKDDSSDKREKLIEQLFKRKAFADYWSMKWSDLFRVKAEFPINLWPNGVHAYHQWIRTAIEENMPYNRFANELLTSSGSNFRMPQVNFYRAIQGEDPATIANAVALTLMGCRLEKWPEQEQKNLTAFFSRIKFKGTAEWKETVVTTDYSSIEPLTTNFPYGKPITIQAGDDPRIPFANWLTKADNPWFTKAVVNRIWFWIMGRGIIHEADDICNDNKPVNPQLLAFLEKELKASNYDLRHIYRLILNSKTYQQSSLTTYDYQKAEKHFAVYQVRRIGAEVLIDAICDVTGTTEQYSSPIPEPFTFIPEEHQTIELADGSITSMFLELFGRPSRDTGLLSERNITPTSGQRLHLLNSTHIQNKILKSYKLSWIFKARKMSTKTKLDQIYLTILSRFPTNGERETVAEHFGQSKNKKRLDLRKARDLVWSLMNSKEFLYRH